MNLVRKYWPYGFLLLSFGALVYGAALSVIDTARRTAEAHVKFEQSLTTEAKAHIAEMREKLRHVIYGSLVEYVEVDKKGQHPWHHIFLSSNPNEEGGVAASDKFNERRVICPDNDEGLLAIEDISLKPEPSDKYGLKAFGRMTQKLLRD